MAGPRRADPPGGTLDLFGAGGAEGAAGAGAMVPAVTPATPSTKPAPAARPIGPGPAAAPTPAPAPAPLVAPQQSRAPAVPAPAAVAAPVEGPRVYKVAELVGLAGRSLEARYADVWVEGEVSGLRMQQSGHAYLTLKDRDAVLGVVVFRGTLARHRFRLADGLSLRARGRLTIWPQAGRFQMVAEALEPVGLGALQLAFEQRKRQLAAEGLFDEARKRPLPFRPRTIGVATSPTGAAVRDIIRVAHRRGPARLLLAPCLVQGDQAPDEIVRALRDLQSIPEVELIIVGRGGGSAEDLAAFNDERVARAVAACRVPVISAVGHEIDFTICDFVADRRAATPSQAAELAVPLHDELARELAVLSQRVSRAAFRALGEARQLLDAEGESLAAAVEDGLRARRRLLEGLTGRLAACHPRAALARDRVRLGELSRRLERPLAEQLTRARRAHEPLARRLDAAMQRELADGRRQVEGLPPRLHAALHKEVAARRSELTALLSALDAMSPLRVLERGYAVVRDAQGHVVQSAARLAVGAEVTLRLSDGTARATVSAVEPGAPASATPAARPIGDDSDGGGGGAA